MKYCQACQQNVAPVKKFSVGWFLLWCLSLIGGFVYIFYYLLKKKNICPICGGKQLNKLTQVNVNQAAYTPTTEPPTMLSKVIDTAFGKPLGELKQAQSEYAIAKAKTAETLRMRKAGELPWQIEKAEKKAAKAAKKAAQ